MQPLTPAQLLELLETGRALGPVQRALTLLSAVDPDLFIEDLAELPIGKRDGKLLQLRTAIFGSQLSALATCPECSQSLELSFAAAEILNPSGQGAPESLSLEENGYKIRIRLPNSIDVMTAADEIDEDAARNELLRRCLLDVRQRGKKLDATELPERVVEAVVGRMSEADPQAVVELGYACPSCKMDGHAMFDVVSFLWTEIDAWAQRILLDVHTLALAYGWSETEVLALSPIRRIYYLSLVGA